MAHAYPVVLILEGKPVLVVGGGSVAERKVRGLLECEADVTIVSPEITEGLRELIDGNRCSWRRGCYDASDLSGVEIVFAATDDENVNVRVFQDATSARLPVNVADRPELCSFFLPSVLRRGNLIVAVSTQGSSPLLARRIREQLEERFGVVYETYVDLLQGVRQQVISEVPERDRWAFWDEATDGRILKLLENDDREGAEDCLAAILSSYSGKS